MINSPRWFVARVLFRNTLSCLSMIALSSLTSSFHGEVFTPISLVVLGGTFSRSNSLLSSKIKNSSRIDISDELREGAVLLETRGEASTDEEVEVGTVETEETGADTVLDTALDVWKGFGVRHGSIADLEGREGGGARGIT